MNVCPIVAATMDGLHGNVNGHAQYGIEVTNMGRI